MKHFQKENENGPDDLTKLLREWRADVDLPPGFQASVWRRIDLATAQQRPKAFAVDLLAWFNQLITRPQLAAAYIALLIMIGVTVGWTQGHREASRIQERLAHRYIASLDPYQPGR